MKFLDEATISVQSGDGGKGCVSFRREAFIPRGGPDGGDGGRGGHVVLKSTSSHYTLFDFRFKKHFKAENGAHGQGTNKTGKNGKDLVIEVPPGTLVKDAATEAVLKDFSRPNETHTIAEGGTGGRGNSRFKSSTNRSPRYAQPGKPGQTLSLKLELKLIADVGIIGMPNAGKSTLISTISSAQPKIGDYPFTTLIPNLGVVQTDWGEPFVVADMPGLIEGAHEGTGLGIQFLRHIERTRILIHMIDGTAIEPDDPTASYTIVNRELEQYSEALAAKPQIVVVNKLDVPGIKAAAGRFEAVLKPIKVFQISALTRQGIADLLYDIRKMLDELNDIRQG
ncbi:MAG TPA: GTPase ObgE [Deltaproteobacteria bacterium]|nr:GTPase ObgE [Deltaproteobacteria bacterium]